MSSFSSMIAVSILVGSTILACQSSAMAADSITPTGTQAAPAISTHQIARETVEQRIASLHTSLGITPGEEADWNGVTKAMRENAAVMAKLVAEKSAEDPASTTAVNDLMTYEKFARAHVEGLKRLTASFTTLYKSMPDTQKKVADQVFQSFNHERQAAHS